jgi:hypothetical protein
VDGLDTYVPDDLFAAARDIKCEISCLALVFPVVKGVGCSALPVVLWVLCVHTQPSFCSVMSCGCEPQQSARPPGGWLVVMVKWCGAGPCQLDCSPEDAGL